MLFHLSDPNAGSLKAASSPSDLGGVNCFRHTRRHREVAGEPPIMKRGDRALAGAHSPTDAISSTAGTIPQTWCKEVSMSPRLAMERVPEIMLAGRMPVPDRAFEGAAPPPIRRRS